MPFDSLPAEVPVRHAAEIAILDRMAKLLATPERWCKHDYTNGLWGKKRAFCLDAALHMAAREELAFSLNRPDSERRVEATFVRLLRGTARERIHHYNDHGATKHKSILALIARARREFEGV